MNYCHPEIRNVIIRVSEKPDVKCALSDKFYLLPDDSMWRLNDAKDGWVQVSAGNSGGSDYVLPPATTTTLGGVIAGKNVDVQADGTLSGHPNIYAFVNNNGTIVLLFSTTPDTGEYTLDLTNNLTNETTNYALDNKEWDGDVADKANYDYNLRIWRKGVTVFEDRLFKVTSTTPTIDISLKTQDVSPVTSSDGNIIALDITKQLNLVVVNLSLSVKSNYGGTDRILPAGTINEAFRPVDDEIIAMSNDAFNATAYIQSDGGVTFSTMNPMNGQVAMISNFSYFV